MKNKNFKLGSDISKLLDQLIKEDIIIYHQQKGWSINEEYLAALENKSRYKYSVHAKHNLPAETNEFIGRKAEMKNICTLLENARLVTLVGSGGIGKSRLSLKVAQLCLSKYNDGVFLIPAAKIRKPKLLISNIANVLDIPEIEGQDILDTVKNTLRNKKILIILDDFDHLTGSAHILTELLTVAAHLSLIVTSRQPLNVYGEHLFNVPPLEVPDSASAPTVELLEKLPSVSLFLSRAKAIKNDFSLTEENAQQIAKLCECLEGIPLAIELAAANIAKISVNKMLSMVQNRLNWLTDGPKNLPMRHRNMKNCIEWGFKLLNKNQKKIFTRLGAFKGKFSISAAATVINKNNDIDNLDKNLLSLVNRSFLSIDSEADDSDECGFNMLEIFREYAVFLLSKDSDEKFIKECHADYFLSYAVAAQNKYYDSKRQTALNMLDKAYPDIICALEYFSEAKYFEKELELAVSMGYYWETRGLWDKGQSILESIIQKQNNPLNIQHCIKAYQWLGRFAFLNGNCEKAVKLFEQGLKLAMERNDPMGEASIKYNLALTNNISGNLHYEVELLNQSLKIYREAGYKRGIAEVLQELSQAYYFNGSYEEAEICLNESLDIYKEYDDKYGILESYGRMGLVLRANGEFEKAMQMFQKCLSGCEEIDDKSEMTLVLLNIAELLRSQGDYVLAQTYYLKSLNLAYELGYLAIIARIKKDLGEICHHTGDIDKAYELFNESLSLMNETGHKGDVPWVYRNLAELELTRENYLKAEELFLNGLKLYVEINQNTLCYIFLIFEGLATVSAKLGDLIRAACLFAAADKLLHKVGNLLAKSDINSYHNRLNALRQEMDADTFESSWNEGSSMSLKHAIGYALNDNKYDRTMANKMLNYIQENYTRDISLYDIAEYFNMSVSYLSTMFKYYTGKNFKEYLNLYRVKASKELMQKESNLKIGEIAKRVGCNGSVTFIRMFRKYEGMSPGQYYSKLSTNKN